MSEGAVDFAKRMGGEVKSFATQKSKEVSNTVQKGVRKVVSSAEKSAYLGALSLVANWHDLTPDEAEARLQTPSVPTPRRRRARRSRG